MMNNALSFGICIHFQLYQQANDNDDDDGESLDELIELLRASSESHGEDDAVWDNFRKEIIQRRKDFLSGENVRKVCCITI